MKPVFYGNFDYETRHSDLDRLFCRYGKVDRIDMKSGFAFVCFEDERDVEEAIHDLHDRPFGHSRRRLSVEWSRQGDRGGPRHRDGSKSMANTRHTKTLFVINFDPNRTRNRDIERHFEPYGKLLNIRIRRNFAFVQFKTQEEATKALECTNMSKILDRVVSSVEYALRDDGESGDSPRRGGGGRYGGRHSESPPHGGRSVSPVNRRSCPSPDYGRTRSLVYDRHFMNPLQNAKISQCVDLKNFVESGIRGYRTLRGGNISRVSYNRFKWSNIQCSKQTDGIHCGHYVCCFIEDILSCGDITIPISFVHRQRLEHYSPTRMHNFQINWAGYLYNRFIKEKL